MTVVLEGIHEPLLNPIVLDSLLPSTASLAN
jgi:hypothetical protein